MQFNNLSPFPGIAWDYVTTHNEYFVTTMVRVKFAFHPTDHAGKWLLKPDPDQGELFDADIYYGEVGATSVRYESDYVGYKAHTDVIVNASAHAPRKKPKKSWKTTIEVYSHEHNFLKKYSLIVRGEKKYRRVGPLWLTFGRKKVLSVPIRYENAYGGTIMKPLKKKEKTAKCIKVDPYNPVGCGMKKISDPKKTVFAPQIFYVGQKHKTPAGFGYINRAWKTRLPYAGTYDKEWLDSKHPFPPEDYDPYYNQAAHPELIMEGYLRGKATFRLENLSPNNEIKSFSLLDYSLLSRVVTHTGELYREMHIDTVIIDLDGEGIDDYRVYVSYRSRTPKMEEVTSVEVLFADYALNGDSNGH